MCKITGRARLVLTPVAKIRLIFQSALSSDVRDRVPGLSLDEFSFDRRGRVVMTTTENQLAMDTRPPEGRITEESLAAAKEMIGTYLPPESPFIQDVTVDTIRTYCNGIG